MSSVSELVAEKMAASPEVATGNTPKKMIVFITEADTKVLGNIAAVCGSGKIDLGSELLRLSIADALKQCVKAQKMNEKGEILGADGKPIAPPAPKPAPVAPAAPAVPA